jgi:hypothetical protein
MKSKKIILFLVMFFAVNSMLAQRNKQNSPQLQAQSGIASKVAGMIKHDGYFVFYLEEKTHKIFLEIDKLDAEFLYINSLPAGIGSNDIGLDRGQLGGERIVKFVRYGPKVLMIQPNYDYRAISQNELERKAVEQAFAQSVLWGFKVEAEDGGKVLIELTDFIMQDAHNVVGRLRSSRQGNYKLDASRSALYPERIKNFPQNTEFEVTLTFSGTPEGGWIRSVTPSPDAITVRQHHSFVQLPDDDYEPRDSDPRAGYFGMSFYDYATPISENIQKRFIARHRLKKKDPTAAMSEPVEPIIYYLDPGVPEPVRSALLDGASWWNQAFEAAGYRNAFRVEMLPADADPMDVRYNLIQWIHRSTRGWSYGASVSDPRTGEIIKGQVSLGSLRVRQDFLIAQGLIIPYEEGKPASPEMEKLALARLRQLSAHEVGHTLGLAHNYIASYNNRASVMDYPHPLAEINSEGKIVFTNAYDDKIGAWDKVSIRYGYSDFPDGTDVKKALNDILMESARTGLRFISDQDARPQGSAHPYAHLWDNGNDASVELNRLMDVRKKALSQLSENNIKMGEPLFKLEAVMVPIYLLHRYQIEAAAKVVGGVHYDYKIRGDNLAYPTFVSGDDQRAALQALLRTLSSDELALPANLLKLLPPPPIAYGRGREMFTPRTGLAFDYLAPAETAAELTIQLLLHPDRTSRLVEISAIDPSNLFLGETFDAILNATWKKARTPGYKGEVERTVNYVVLQAMFNCVANGDQIPQAQAIASQKLDELDAWLNAQVNRTSNADEKAHLKFAMQKIAQFRKDPEKVIVIEYLRSPDGPPIGMFENWCSN